MQRRWHGYTHNTPEADEAVKLVVQKLELTDPFDTITVPEGYKGLRLFLAWQGELLGYCTIWQDGPSVVGRDRLIAEAVATQAERLTARLSPGKESLSADPAWLREHFDELVAHAG